MVKPMMGLSLVQAQRVGTMGRYSAGPFALGLVLAHVGDLLKYNTMQYSKSMALPCSTIG